MAPSVRVVAKRNTLWPVFAPLPEGKPLQFTLEVNPYRAALIDYVSTRGNLLLTPLGAADQKALDEKMGLVRAHVTSATPLDSTQQRELTAKLASVTGKHVRMELSVDSSLIGGVVAQVGDLMESMIKRDCERKDASDAVPGFGGILDVIDSLIFAAPVAFVFWLRYGP